MSLERLAGDLGDGWVDDKLVYCLRGEAAGAQLSPVGRQDGVCDRAPGNRRRDPQVFEQANIGQISGHAETREGGAKAASAERETDRRPNLRLRREARMHP